VSWGSGIVTACSVFFLPYLTLYQQAIHSALLLGMCAGCVAVNVGYIGIVAGFLAPIITALTAFWLAQAGSTGNWEAGAVAMLTFFFAGTLVFLARDTWRTFERSVAIRLENAELARRLESALQRAEAASRSKTRFLASASHDLRQPLHSLSLNAAALAFRPLDERGREIVRDMGEALEDLSYELDSLLDISKLDAGVVPVQPAMFEFTACLARICQSFDAIAKARALHFRTQWPDEVWVSTDRKLLEGIVRNLLDNAFKYTTFGTVRVDARVENGRCVVAISDTGIGIAPAEQERVFEEFYQVGNPERDRRKGLGLGLPIVRRHSELLGLPIRMSSAPGQGTTFTLDLAVVPPPPRAEPVKSGLIPAFQDRQFLVIDDEAGSREAMQSYLLALGCQVSVAATINEATALAQVQEPDLVIADFRLRGSETGLQAIEALRKTRPTLAALLITGETAPERLTEMNAARIPVLHKPVPPAVLIDNIANLLNDM
jgi:signal transduction histidine kinase/CheY-like chemotaxis protein